MRMDFTNLKHTVAALALWAGLAGGAAAQEDADGLLQSLRTAPPQEAAAISRKLEAGWRKSGSAAMDLLLQRGADALEEGDYALAIDHLTALTDHAPGFAEGWHLRAQAYYRRSLYGPALADLERTLALNPDQYNAIFGFATMVQEFGDSARAAALYRMVLDLNPHHENAQKALDALRREGIGRRL
ncbi:hypothetical protein A3728_07990 [Sulfitobacter sp. HI0040]|nr:hypothetical protein A3721_16970 [Sulfitobacter sp. HI0023]KZY23593.1 hypothetical protein A3728_07990 [Sulfitobacter sp. HI0040]KZZ63772.1 hypothetical protein A3764_21170 [Sulfitobacter sp. HI0129]